MKEDCPKLEINFNTQSHKKCCLFACYWVVVAIILNWSDDCEKKQVLEKEKKNCYLLWLRLNNNSNFHLIFKPTSNK